MSAKPDVADRISALELRNGGLLAFVFGFRMLGLFLVLPIFPLYALTLPGGHDQMWVGLAMGAFGLVQALLQIPLGLASDVWGRKPVIFAGLLVFALGSLMAAWAPSVGWLLAARCLQGAGAISGAVSALAADLTRPQHRAKVMAMIGMSIAVVFSVSLVAAPSLYAWVGMPVIFLLIGALALGAIAVVAVVPTPSSVHRLVELEEGQRGSIFKNGQLWRLNLGVFSKHMIQMSMFFVIPGMLVQQFDMPVGRHWMVYLPVVLGSFLLSIPCIIWAEKTKAFKRLFLWGIGLILLSQLGLFLIGANFWILVTMLFLFFVAFNTLEATMPSLVSRIVSSQARGLALGVFNTSQALGAGLGAAASGAIMQSYGSKGVFGLAIVVCLIWGFWVLSMNIVGFLKKENS